MGTASIKLMRILFVVAMVMAGTCVKAVAAFPPYIRNDLTTNPITIGASMSIAGNVLEAVSVAPIISTASYAGAGTNFHIDASILTNNTIIRLTLTKASGLILTNLAGSDGKVFELEIEEDATGGWRLIANTNAAPNWRFSQEIPELFVQTNATILSGARLKVRGTNGWLVGNLSQFRP